MGDAVKSLNRAVRFELGMAAALAAAALLTGCASASPQSASAGSPAAATAAAPAPQPPAAAQLSRLDVVEGAPGTRIDIASDSTLVWTTYRDADGNLVIELPNARPAAGFAGSTYSTGVVSEIRVAREGSEERPLTRLVVATREEAEHALTSDAGGLHIDLVATAPAAAVAQAAPPPAEAPAAPLAAEAWREPAPAAAPAAPALAEVGTVDRPAVAPPPAGTPASHLAAVEVVAEGAAPAVRLVGDGEFAYSSFRLENPDRFVIDLEGVTNAAPRGPWTVGGDAVSRVRVSQFKPQPQPVSRVVFDLARPLAPSITRDADGLVVRFSDATVAATLAEDLAAPAPPPAAAVEAVTAAAEPPAPAPVETTVPAEPEPESVAAVEPEPTPEAAPAPVETVAAAAPPPAVSDVQAFAPAPAAAAPAAAPASGPASVAAFEAADVQQAPPPAPAAVVPVPAAYSQQTVGGGKKQYVGEPISLSLKDADVKDVLRSFAKISGLNVVVQPGVRGTVTVELESVPWDQALDQILKINGLGYELDGNIMRIAPTETLEAEARRAQTLAQAQALSVPLRTVVKRLSYSTADQMARILQTGSRVQGGGILSQRGTVTVDGRTNTLIIKELPNYIDTVIAVIETLDIPEPQVMIEARIVETTKRFNRTLGISWGFNAVADAAHGNTTGLMFPNNAQVEGGVNVLTGGSNGFIDLALGNILDTFTLDMRLQAAESEGLINVLSAPKIATLNNESATIQSGLQIPIQTVANNTVTVQFVNATLRLQVTPHVTAEGTILMDVSVQKREPQLAFAVVGAQNAPIATKEAQTRVIVRDGGTTVIGGIYKVSTDQGQDRVPGLANVPILGELFKNRRRLDENEELLIFITPRVIKL